MTDLAAPSLRSPAAEGRAPAVLGCAVVFAAAALGLVGARLLPAAAPAASRPIPVRPAAPGWAVLQIVVRPGERLPEALRRAGVAWAEARIASALLGQTLDAAHLRAGALLRAVVSRPQGSAGPARLERVTLATGPRGAATVGRTADGAFTLARTAAPAREDAVVAGVIRGSLYASAVGAGAAPTLVAQAVKLFSASLDFARDMHVGDAFRLVVERRADADGRGAGAGDLLYAEVTAGGRVRRFYRFEHDGRVDYVDAAGAQSRPLLLKTPLDGAHVTSGFGLRLHPILGYTRLHPGIDFGAPVGTPVFAAGDGVVEEARWAGGYGHWLKLGHRGGWETGYGHLSAYAPGVKPGVRVAQGEVVGFVGSTGLSTGPHLHYEIMRRGSKVDPLTAAVPAGHGGRRGPRRPGRREAPHRPASGRRPAATLAARPAGVARRLTGRRRRPVFIGGSS